jgi:hypothetical protein
VSVSNHDTGEDDDLFGPYTEPEARRVAARIERMLRRKAEADDADGVVDQVGVYPLRRWGGPGPFVRLPRRPDCPDCGRKMNVWHGTNSDSSYANCPDCAIEVEVTVDAATNRYVLPEETEP